MKYGRNGMQNPGPLSYKPRHLRKRFQGWSERAPPQPSDPLRHLASPAANWVPSSPWPPCPVTFTPLPKVPVLTAIPWSLLSSRIRRFKSPLQPPMAHLPPRAHRLLGNHLPPNHQDQQPRAPLHQAQGPFTVYVPPRPTPSPPATRPPSTPQRCEPSNFSALCTQPLQISAV